VNARPLTAVVWASVASLVGCGAASGLLLPEEGLASDDSGMPANRASDASDAGSDASTHLGHDAARDAWSAVCPTTAPVLGSACSDEGLVCEYGGRSDASCDTVSACSGGVWISALPPGSPTGCPPGPNPETCPATFGSVPSGSPCAEAATCTYSEGYCVCELVVLPEVTAPEMLWGCGPEPGCPPVPPRLGAECSTPGRTCTYPPCVGAACGEQGYWQPVDMSCGG